MAEDWSIDVKKYVPDADDKVIAAIVRYCGIALQSRDASLVSFTDPVETGRVRDNYCRKKLGLTQPDEEVDAMIAAVGERMKGDNTRNRVTVYYLLAEMAGKLGLFGAAAAATAAVAEPLPAAEIPAAPVAPPSPPPPAAPVATASAAALAAAPVLKKDRGGFFGIGAGALAVIGAIIIGTGLIGTLIGQRVDNSPIAPDPVPATPITAPAPVVTAPVIPEGAGLVAEEVAGKPRLSVYFDTAKADVTPDLPNEIGALKTYVDSNPTARLGVSGYNDPRGNPAFNAELSKNRAENVAAALAALGFPADRIDLVKPADTTDDTTTLVNARRVDVYVQE
jgi:outer membrane protein OmpA-like peptidoglycan-associated protein